jgi:hypothetical protein
MIMFLSERRFVPDAMSVLSITSVACMGCMYWTTLLCLRLYRAFQEEWYRENVVYVTLHRYNQTYLYIRSWTPSEVMTWEKFGILAVVRTGRVSTWFVMRTLRRSVIVSIAKPSHAEVSVLCKVLGRVRTILMKILRGFLTKSVA